MKKKAKQPPMSENEKEVMGHFERMFTFEFYIRYLEMNRSHDLRRIQRLNKVVTNRLVEFYTVNGLSEFEIKSDCNIPFSLDSTIDWILEVIQFNNNFDKNLTGRSINIFRSMPENLREYILAQIKALKGYVKQNQEPLPYDFYDLARPNNINDVFKWWFEHIDLLAYEQNKIVRDISMKKEELPPNADDSFSDSICRIHPDFLSPSVRLDDQNLYAVYSTNKHSIKVDGQELSNSIVLCIRFDNDDLEIGEALDLFSAYINIDRSTWQASQSKPESTSKYVRIHGKQYSGFALPHKSDQYAKVIAYRSDSVTKNLLGLMCFDEKIKSNKSTPAAAETISNRIRDSFGLDYSVSTIEDDHNDVCKKINTIDQVVKLKQNRLLFNQESPFKTSKSSKRKK